MILVTINRVKAHQHSSCRLHSGYSEGCISLLFSVNRISSLSLSLPDITVVRQLGGISLQYEQVIGDWLGNGPGWEIILGACL